jgi:environmental stress-induced protein Ves
MPPSRRFRGIVRTLAVIEGAGLTLAVAGDAPVTLDQAAVPYRFAADQPAEARLLDGPVSNLNIMTRRASCTHLMQRVRFQGELEVSAASTLLVLCPTGGIEIGGTSLGPLDCALIEENRKGRPAQQRGLLGISDRYFPRLKRSPQPMRRHRRSLRMPIPCL